MGMAMFLPYLFFFVILNLVLGNSQAHVVPYDHSFTLECLKTPLGPQYGGGVVSNPELNQKLNGWKEFGGAKVEHRVSNDGNNYIVATPNHNVGLSPRNTSLHSFAHDFILDQQKLYAFSGWFQVTHGKASIAAIIKTRTQDVVVGRVIAKQGCWSMLKGGFINASGPATLYFESDVLNAEIWGDSISLQPFTHEEWQSHQHQSMEKARKSKVKFQAVDQKGQPLCNAKVSIKQIRPDFPVGNALNQHILNTTAYRNWFLSRFKYTVFEDELKWRNTEKVRGVVNYTIVDSLLEFTKSHGLLTRGHTIFWSDPNQLPEWIKNSTDNYEFFKAKAESRINSVVKRYSGQFIHWDVVNENMHFSFMEDKLGPSASADFFKRANELDPETPLFLNDFFTIEKAVEEEASPPKYLQKIAEIREKGYEGPLGIGLQGHFTWVSPPYIRASLDALAATKLPIWITELDIKKHAPDPAGSFDIALREIHAHPSVQGIILWSAWNPPPIGCWRMCLTDDNFNNLPTGDVIDKFMHELKHGDGLQVTTDANGNFEMLLFHGEYEAEIVHPLGAASCNSDKFIVLPTIEEQDRVQLKIGS